MSCSCSTRRITCHREHWDEQREAFGDTVIDTLAEYAPNIRDIVLHRQVVTPLDLEREWGLTEGNIFQGELSPDQLFFMRPVPDGRSIERRFAASICVAPPRIPAAASWAHPDETRPEDPRGHVRRRPAASRT